MVSWGRRLVHTEADDAQDAVQGSVGALQSLGGWTKDPAALRAFPYVERGPHTGPRVFTRAVLDRARRALRPARSGRRVLWTSSEKPCPDLAVGARRQPASSGCSPKAQLRLMRLTLCYQSFPETSQHGLTCLGLDCMDCSEDGVADAIRHCLEYSNRRRP